MTICIRYKKHIVSIHRTRWDTSLDVDWKPIFTFHLFLGRKDNKYTETDFIETCTQACCPSTWRWVIMLQWRNRIAILYICIYTRYTRMFKQKSFQTFSYLRLIAIAIRWSLTECYAVGYHWRFSPLSSCSRQLVAKINPADWFTALAGPTLLPDRLLWRDLLAMIRATTHVPLASQLSSAGDSVRLSNNRKELTRKAMCSNCRWTRNVDAVSR